MRKSDRNFTRRELLTWSLGLVARGIAVPGILNAETDAAAQEAPVANYRVPRREYVAAKVGSYSFQVEKSLQTADRKIAQKALDRFVKNIDKALETLPKPASTDLRNIHYFVMHGPKAPGGGRTNGLEYIQTNAPSLHAELDPRWGNSMILYCTRTTSSCPICGPSRPWCMNMATPINC